MPTLSRKITKTRSNARNTSSICCTSLLTSFRLLADLQSHKRAMKRWQARLAEVENRPLPSDDPRDVMNEILDDLEDRRTGEPPAEVAKTPKTTEKAETKAPAQEGSKRKNRRRSKAERKDQKAQEALKGVTATDISSVKEATKVTAEGKEGGKGRGLNRRARRLLAKQAAGKDGSKETEKDKPNGNTKPDKPNGTSTAKVDKSSKPKEKKSEKPKESTTTSTPEAAPVEGKEKKRRKRNSEAKAQAA
jgi:hypothetical protein